MSDYLDLFLTRYAGRSRDNHLYSLRAWGAWLDERQTPLAEASRQDVEEYLAHMRTTRGWAPRTVRTAIGHLSNFYRWLLDTGAITVDPTALIKRPRAPHSERPWLGRVDLSRLLTASLDWADGELAPQVHLWALCGLRPGEPRALSIKSLGSHDGSPTLMVAATKTPGYERIVIPDSVAALLARASDGRKRGALLVNPRTGRAWTKTAERGRFQRMLAETDLPAVTPYGLRVSFITLALAAGIPEREVMIGARHSSSAQTARYDRLRAHVNAPVGPRLEAWLYSSQTQQQAG